MPLPPGREMSRALVRVLMANLPVEIAKYLHEVLSDVPDIQVADPLLDAQHVITMTEVGSVDVILIGYRSAEGVRRATETIRLLREWSGQAKFLVLSEHPDYVETIALFRAGAKGILSGRDLQSNLLCKSIRCVHDGQVWANNELMQYLVASLSPLQSRDLTDARGRRLLTSREQEVLYLLASGLSNADLAVTLKVSEHTVKNHLSRIYDKLGVSNRTEAVLYALTPRTQADADKNTVAYSSRRS